MKQRDLQITNDGSHTIMHHLLNQTYHSRHGAIKESMHVFIEAGLLPMMQQKPSLKIFEFGFGTGLNAWLTSLQTFDKEYPVYYETIEAHPVEEAIWKLLNFGTFNQHKEAGKILFAMHEAPWEKACAIHEYFTLEKKETDFSVYQPSTTFDLVYFDAFSPTAQPELWTINVFERMMEMMNTGGRLTTYCSKGDVRRNMMAAGLQVQKIAGPPGKREMVVATKP